MRRRLLALGAVVAGLAALWLLWMYPWPGGAALNLVKNLAAVFLIPYALFFLISSRPVREKAALTLIGAVSIVLMFLLFEIPSMIGWADYRLLLPARIYPPVLSPDYVLDRELIHVRRPHTHMKGSARGGALTALYDLPRPALYRWDFRSDRNGFRNATDRTEADVAVLGDSFIEGTFVAESQIVTSVLGRLLGATVANLGQNGYGPLHELVVLKRFALPLKPATVVWVFYEGNDLKNVADYRQMSSGFEALVAARESRWERSFTRNILRSIEGWAGRIKPSAMKRSCLVRSSGPERRTYFLDPAAELSQREEEALEVTRRSIEQASQLCAAAKTRFLVVFAPNKFRVLAPFCKYGQESEVRSWTLNNLPARMRTTVEGIPGASFLDLTATLAEVERSGGIPFPDDEHHWSAAGHAAAARAIHTHLAQPISGW